MSSLTGKEPAHWHTPEGKHNMTDPRGIEGYRPRDWEADERAYVDHLNAHDAVERRPSDTPEISVLFDLIEAREQEIKKARELIRFQRERAVLS